ncbi:MAG TPA: hypothetical protein VD772_12205, partial [Anseongella sp.]|nr:hypothetical protein [Anseongella sp.]
MNSKTYPPQKYNEEISLQEAIEITTNWRNFIAPFNKACANCEEGYPAFVDGFTVPINDLLQLQKEKGFSTLRIYLGKDYNTTTGKYGNCRLVLVGVEENGTLVGSDIIGADVNNSQ